MTLSLDLSGIYRTSSSSGKCHKIHRKTQSLFLDLQLYSKEIPVDFAEYLRTGF